MPKYYSRLYFHTYGKLMQKIANITSFSKNDVYIQNGEKSLYKNYKQFTLH